MCGNKSFEEVLGELRNKFNNGMFILLRNQTIGDAINNADQNNKPPDKPGVYIIRDSNGVIYVGKGGTLKRVGNSTCRFTKQRLPGRLEAPRGGAERANDFYERLMDEGGVDQLEIEWICTCGCGDDGCFQVDLESPQIIPAKAEADVLHAYFEDNATLPRENKHL